MTLIHKTPDSAYIRLLKTLRSLQTLCGATAIFLIPVLWGAWSTTTLGYVLGAMFVALAIFIAINTILQGPTQRGEL
jgi:hypothetical protein